MFANAPSTGMLLGFIFGSSSKLSKCPIAVKKLSTSSNSPLLTAYTKVYIWDKVRCEQLITEVIH